MRGLPSGRSSSIVGVLRLYSGGVVMYYICVYEPPLCLVEIVVPVFVVCCC